MAYRDDLQAALVRTDVLEGELAQLHDTQTKLRHADERIIELEAELDEAKSELAEAKPFPWDRTIATGCGALVSAVVVSGGSQVGMTIATMIIVVLCLLWAHGRWIKP